MIPLRSLAWVVFATGVLSVAPGQTEFAANHVRPNLADTVARPLRYRPEGSDFVIENGAEFFNRPLYGGNTAFRVDGGDRPEFVLYLPGRGGNLRLGVKTAAGATWLHAAARIESRYRPGELLYEIRDPLLGANRIVRVAVVALAETEGVIVRVEAIGTDADLRLVWAFGGASGQRGKRDGDIGTESVPISQWFQLRPEYCRGQRFEFGATGFTLRAKAATIAGVVPAGAQQFLANASHWNDLPALLTGDSGGATASAKPELPIVVGETELRPGAPCYLALQRIAVTNSENADLDTYREVTAPRKAATGEPPTAPAGSTSGQRFSVEELPDRFAGAERHFAMLRERVSVDTPDPFLNAAVGALGVAADAVWDEPQQAIMHGAIAWRTKLLGWRGPYSLDALGWHDRARQNISYWIGRQNTDPIPTSVPPPDEKANLARNEAGLHTNGDLSNSHYDMNLVFFDVLFRHLQWTGDLEFARQVWPVIERHLAWERRLFRREFGSEKLPLYEAYAAIWASDDLQYSGGGVMHSSAYNYYENRQAARLAKLIGADPVPYEREAELLSRAMRELLWVVPYEKGEAQPIALAERLATTTSGWFAESKDWLGLQRVHPSAALWTFYHTMDSEVPTSREAWQLADYVATSIPHLPVRGAGVPDGLVTLGTSTWMPYDWSINNVVMTEAVHGALGLWQAGQPVAAWSVTKGSLLAAMFMGISPGNVGSMSYLDVYRRESQRDFADGDGVLSRALVEGLFGLKPDALAGELRIQPGWPAEWDRASIHHPDLDFRYQRTGEECAYSVEQRFAQSQAVRFRLLAPRDRIESVTLDGAKVTWRLVDDSVGAPRIEVVVPPASRHVLTVRWAGERIRPVSLANGGSLFVEARQGEMRWLQSRTGSRSAAPASLSGVVNLEANVQFEPVPLGSFFNDSVTQIFRNEYRSPRSPFVSVSMPKQGIGGWAGGVNKTATIDDAGIRAASAKGQGRIVLPNGVPLVTPAEASARNVIFTSQWDNYPRLATVPLSGRARSVFLLMAGSTNAMQSRFENGRVVVTYQDGSTANLPLVNPTTWWPIEQDYFIDDFQFPCAGSLPIRVDLKTGKIRVLEPASFVGQGGPVSGGAATVLALALDPTKELRSLTVQATANDVVIGLMAVTLTR